MKYRNSVAKATFEVEYFYKQFKDSLENNNKAGEIESMKWIGDAISASLNNTVWEELDDFLGSLDEQQLISIKVIEMSR